VRTCVLVLVCQRNLVILLHLHGHVFVRPLVVTYFALVGLFVCMFVVCLFHSEHNYIITVNMLRNVQILS